MNKQRAEQLASQWGLEFANDSVEHTIAQRDALLGAVGRIGEAVHKSAAELAVAIREAEEVAELVEAIVSETAFD